MSSCQLQQFSRIKDVNEIQKSLFDIHDEPENKEDERWNADEWSQDWDFVKNENPDDAEGPQEEVNWIQKCCFSLSPSADFSCFAYKDKAVFLSGEYTAQRFSDQSPGILDVCFKGSLSEDEGEMITAVLCLPLVSLSRTSHGSRDWTCTLVGFSTGYIRMYTEAGGLLISELLHESPVVQLSCRTFDTFFNLTHNGSAEHHDELTILYGDALVSIEGFSLFQTLRACRNELALATARGTTNIDPPPLSYKKWVLRGHEKIGSHLSTGVMSLSPFDQMHNACVLDGYTADIKSGTNAMSQYITAGSGPFVGFYYAIEGSTQPFLSHVALAVASKLKSALFNAATGWLSWRQKPQPDDVNKPKPKPKVEIGTGLDIRCGLPDLLRCANDIVLAPGANWLAAVSDSFGRVMLLDLVKNRALRMWKGYRDAQIGFIQTNENTNFQPKTFRHPEDNKWRMALFLVIYAPRRGVLEVWSCINGPRVGTFNIGKNSKLIYPGYGMFGLNKKKDAIGSAAFTIQCCLLEKNGEIKDISIPFHLALSDSTSNKARDIHLLKSVSQLLQAGSKDGDELAKLISSMRLSSVQMQAIKKLMLTNHISSDILKHCFDQVMQQLSHPELKKDEKELLGFVKAQNSLLDLYLSFQKLNTSSTDRDPQPLQETTADGLSKELVVTKDEAENIIELMTEFNGTVHSPESKEDRTLSISEFLRCFNVNVSEACPYSLATNSSAKISLLCKYFFYLPLFANLSSSDVIDTVQNCVTIPNKEILFLAFRCWLQNESSVLKDPVASINRLKTFVEVLTKRSEDSENVVMISLGDWIKQDICYPSKSILSAYLIALSCRAVDVAKKSDKAEAAAVAQGEDEAEAESGGNPPPSYDEAVNETSLSSPSSGWETLWPEVELWNQLIKQYEDCLSINTALHKSNQDMSKPDEREISMSEVTRVTVYDLLHNGPGYIPELIAKKISSLNLPPASIFKDSSCHKEDDAMVSPSGSFIAYLQSELVLRFPKLLSSNSVHAHCFWHEMIIWNRDPEVVSHLHQAIGHIRLIKCEPHMQHGLALMAWRTFMAKRFISLAKLVDKVGKAPKDRLCRKETGMSVIAIPTFCHGCTQLLQAVADADPDQFPKPSVEIDQVYGKALADDTWLNASGKESITEMGRDQSTANHVLVQLTMHLSFIIDGVMEFTLRGVKPLAHMFDSNNRNNFLVDLTTSRVVVSRSQVIDDDICKHRKQFLCKVIRAAVSRMHSSPADVEVERNMKEWVETSVHMSAEFRLDDSQIRIQYICELFKFGLDSMAHDLMKTCGNNRELASRLMVIVGQRLHHLLLATRPEDGVIIMSQMSTMLSSWVKAQDPKELDVPDIDARDTLFLAREILTLLPDDHEQYSLSEFLVEALSVVVNS